MDSDNDYKEEKKEIKNLQQYASRFPLLTAEEERTLTCRIYELRSVILVTGLVKPQISPVILSSIVPEFNRLCEDLINRNLRLALKECQKPTYLGRGLPVFDLFMAAYDGLQYAAKYKYNPHMVNPKTGRTNKFSTYATYWIKQRIGREIEKKGSSVKIAGHIQNIMSKIRMVTRIYISRNNNAKPSPETIVQLLHEKYPNNPTLKDITPEKVSEYGRLGWDILSLNEEINTEEGNLTLGDFLQSAESYQPEVEYEEIERKEQINKILAKLDKDERLIIAYKFGLIDQVERSPKAISKLMGIPLKDFQKKYEAAMEKFKKLGEGLKDYY